jgi:hypothetical protein
VTRYPATTSRLTKAPASTSARAMRAIPSELTTAGNQRSMRQFEST